MDGEVDPAAAFLAREQDELADIAEDTLGFTSPTIEQPAADYRGDNLFGTVETGGTEEPSLPDLYASDPYAAVSNMDTLQAEPECIQRWREEHTEMLAMKDRAEVAALEELTNQAKVEIDEWYIRHEEQTSQTKGINRQAETAFIEERDEDIPGHEWERVARLCDFNPKNSKGCKDVSRMRSIFLQLKQTPLVRD